MRPLPEASLSVGLGASGKKLSDGACPCCTAPNTAYLSHVNTTYISTEWRSQMSRRGCLLFLLLWLPPQPRGARSPPGPARCPPTLHLLCGATALPCEGAVPSVETTHRPPPLRPSAQTRLACFASVAPSLLGAAPLTHACSVVAMLELLT